MLSLVIIVDNNKINAMLEEIMEIINEIIIINLKGYKIDSIEEPYASKVSKTFNDIDIYDGDQFNKCFEDIKGHWFMVIKSNERIKVDKRDLLSKISKSNNNCLYIKVLFQFKLKRTVGQFTEFQRRIIRKEKCATYNNYHWLEFNDKPREAERISGEIENFGYLDKEILEQTSKSLFAKLEINDIEKNLEIRAMLGFYNFLIKKDDLALNYLLEVWHNMHKKRETGIKIAILISLFYYEKNKPMQSIDFLNRAIELYPESLELQLYKGVAYKEVNNLPLAISTLFKANKNNENPGYIPYVKDAEILINETLGDIFQTLEIHDRAIDAFTEAIRKKAKKEIIEKIVKSLKAKKTNSKEILDFFYLKVKLQGKFHSLLLAFGLYNNGYYKETIEICKTIQNAEAILLQIKALINTGEINEAKDMLREIDPNERYYIYLLYESIILNIIIDRIDLCHISLKKIILLKNHSPLDLLCYLINYQMEVSKAVMDNEEITYLLKRIAETGNVEIIEKTEEYLAKGVYQNEYQLLFGNILNDLGFRFLALSNYKIALQNGYLDFQSAMALGDYTLEADEYVTAEKLYRKAMELNPYHYDPYKRLTQIYLLEADNFLQIAQEITLHPKKLLGKRQGIQNIINSLE